MTRIDWSYVAGFFDGEGTVGTSGKYSICASISQKDLHVLDLIVHFLLGQGVEANINGYPSGASNLCIRARSLKSFLEGVRPYVIVKKQVVEDAWRSLRLFPKRGPGGRYIPGVLPSEARWGNHTKPTDDERRKQDRDKKRTRYWSDPEYRETIKQRVLARYNRTQEKKSGTANS